MIYMYNLNEIEKRHSPQSDSAFYYLFYLNIMQIYLIITNCSVAYIVLSSCKAVIFPSRGWHYLITTNLPVFWSVP